MGKLFITDQAPCMCKYGTTPGKLKINSQDLMIINASKKIATSMELGDCFYPPGFTICKFSYPYRPCKANIVKWSNFYKKMRVKVHSYPLMPDSKATCAVAGSECIEIVNHGQIEILGVSHVKNATAEHQTDLDPSGAPMGLSDDEIVNVTGLII